jgi:hypothetical protein
LGHHHDVGECFSKRVQAGPPSREQQRDEEAPGCLRESHLASAENKPSAVSAADKGVCGIRHGTRFATWTIHGIHIMLGVGRKSTKLPMLAPLDYLYLADEIVVVAFPI